MYRITLQFSIFLAIISSLWANQKPSVLITGANRGIGLVFAKNYLADGYDVYGTVRKLDEGAELKEMGATVLALDVTSEESIDQLAQALKGKSLDILINNAGYYGPNPIGTPAANIYRLTRSEMDLCFQVNVMGPIFVTQALLPNLEAGKQKKIIHMGSRQGCVTGHKGGGAYGYRVTKTALTQVMQIMHAQLAPKGFIVVSVEPGHVKTDMGTAGAALTPEETIPKLKKVIEGLTPEQSGRFWFYDGSELPW